MKQHLLSLTFALVLGSLFFSCDRASAPPKTVKIELKLSKTNVLTIDPASVETSAGDTVEISSAVKTFSLTFPDSSGSPCDPTRSKLDGNPATCVIRATAKPGPHSIQAQVIVSPCEGCQIPPSQYVALTSLAQINVAAGTRSRQ